MGFEKMVIASVEEKLQRTKIASFTCGTLFVECAESEARKVFHSLSKRFGLGTVQVHGPIQGEYAFDFVA